MRKLRRGIKKVFSSLLGRVGGAFTHHPGAAGESYWQHLAFTVRMGWGFTIVGLIILVHGFFPFFFTKTASVRIEKLYTNMKQRNDRHMAQEKEREKLCSRRTHDGIAGAARVAVIGGGFSGVMVMANMIRRAEQPMTIEWYNAGDTLGTGLAYGTKLSDHLLNVPAIRMGAYAGHPEGFYQWLRTAKGITRTARVWPGNDFEKTSFLPRLLYAEYLKHIMEECLYEAEGKGIAVNIHRATVTDAKLDNPTTQQLWLSTGHGKDKTSILVDAAVLATGNLPPRKFGFLAGINDPKAAYVPDVWNVSESPEFTKRVKYMPDNAEIVILGTGLTMVDMIFTLRSKGYKGKLTAISRNGVLPAVHKPCGAYHAWLWTVDPAQAPKTALGLLQKLRREVKLASVQNYDWRAVVDSLRPVTQKLWQQLDMHEKRRFLAKLSTMWSIHRHRMAPAIHKQVQEMQERGELRIIAGMIYHVGSEKDDLTFSFRRRGSNTFETIYPSLVINCTGPELDIATSEHELLKNLRDRGMITVGPLRVGIEVTAKATAKGEASDALYPVGPMLMGEYLECTAVPELREVADRVADQVIRRVEAISHPDVQNGLSLGEWI